MDERKLSKKEKKALAFRANKGKNKALDAQPGVPEEEDLDAAEASGVPIDDGEGEGAGGAKKDKGKKEKVKVVVGEEAVEGEEVVEGEGEKKKKRQRGKKKSEQRAAATGKVGADGKSRLILFVGNLPFKTSTEDIQAHFKDCGETPIVRLLTPKPNPLATVVKSKGCAFIEFNLSTSLQAALRLHESELAGRKINVELTAGGGGNNAGRKAKIEEKKLVMGEEREKTASNKRKRNGEPEPEELKDKRRKWGKEEEVVAEKPAGKHVIVDGVKKIRDRRVKKVDGMGREKERARVAVAKAARASSGANSIQIG